MTRVRISGEMKPEIRDEINKLAVKESRSFSRMLEIVAEIGLKTLGVKPKTK
jgi:hypothetical protein